MRIDGRCHCGYVSFEAEADPESTTLCNCTDCQTMSGAPLRAVVTARSGTFVLLSGTPAEYRTTAERCVRKDSARAAGLLSIPRRLALTRRLTTSDWAPFASATTWCRAGSC